jgi:hypothetical protein
MVNGRRQGNSRQCEKECDETRESGETSNRSIERHFGLTSGNKEGGSHSLQKHRVLLR